MEVEDKISLGKREVEEVVWVRGVSEQLEIGSDKNVSLGFNAALCPCECVVVCRHAAHRCFLQIRCEKNCFECRHLVVVVAAVAVELLWL